MEFTREAAKADTAGFDRGTFLLHLVHAFRRMASELYSILQELPPSSNAAKVIEKELKLYREKYEALEREWKREWKR